jgi:hypothetical protein
MLCGAESVTWITSELAELRRVHGGPYKISFDPLSLDPEERSPSTPVQEQSGIRTRMLLANWIGQLLEQVAVRAKTNNEPSLTSLCVHQDGTIGQGYALAPKSVDDKTWEDIEYYAAEHRLLCYQKYAKDPPADGGCPALTKAETERRARKTPQAIPPKALPGALRGTPSIRLLRLLRLKDVGEAVLFYANRSSDG